MNNTLNIGDVFGQWTITNNNLSFKVSGCKAYEVTCSCGNKSFTRAYDIVKQRSKRCKSCAYKKISKGYKDISGTLWAKIKYCAKDRNIDFNITPEYAFELLVKQDGRCKLSNLEIELSPFSYQNRYNGTASLDRIDSSKGYIEGNVQWVHKDINQMKMDLPEKRFKELCSLVANHNNSTFQEGMEKDNQKFDLYSF